MHSIWVELLALCGIMVLVIAIDYLIDYFGGKL